MSDGLIASPHGLAETSQYHVDPAMDVDFQKEESDIAILAANIDLVAERKYVVAGITFRNRG